MVDVTIGARPIQVTLGEDTARAELAAEQAAAYLAAAQSLITAFAGPLSPQGRWFYVPGPDRQALLATIRTGSGVRFSATGATAYSLRYMVHPDTTVGQEPIFEIYINGAASGNHVTLSGTPNVVSSVVLASGLTAGITYNFELRLRGLDEGDPRWAAGAGPQLVDVIGGTVSPWPDTGEKDAFYGDSITAGDLARGSAGTPITHGGDVCYGRVFCELAGTSPVINGFGGAGVISDIAVGDIPRYWPGSIINSPAFFHKQGRIVEPEYLGREFVNLGTNDFGAGVSEADFKVGYKALCQALQLANPGGALYCIVPFSQAMRVPITEAAGELNLQIVHTYDWALTYTDGIHPDVAGQDAAGNKLYTAVTTPKVLLNGDFSSADVSMWHVMPGSAASLTVSGGQGHMTGFSQHTQGFSTVKGQQYIVSFDRSGTDPYVQKSDAPGGSVNVVSWNPGATRVVSAFTATANYTFLTLTTFTDGAYDNITVTLGPKALTNGNFSSADISMWPWTGQGSASLVVTSGQGHLSGSFSQHAQGFTTEIGRSYTVTFDAGGTGPFMQKADDSHGAVNVVGGAVSGVGQTLTFTATADFTYLVLTTFSDAWFDNITVTG